MSKKYQSNCELAESILSASQVLLKNVGSTYGPRGRTVILKTKSGPPVVTKDGVTVAKFVEFSDPVQNAIVSILKQASLRTNAEAGDGTTTSTILSGGLIREAIKRLSNHHGASAVEIKRGLDKVLSYLIQYILDKSTPVSSLDDIENIATVSANNDRSIGELISLAVSKVGKNGYVMIEEANSEKTTLDLIEGFRLEAGYASSSFITNERKRTVSHENPLFLLTDAKLETIDQILPALEIAAREDRPLVIISDDVEGQALAALIMNSLRGSMKVVAIKAPSYGESRREIMQDLAMNLGATYLTRLSGIPLKGVNLLHFGSAQSIEITSKSTVIVGGAGVAADISDTISLLKEELKSSENETESQRVMERINRLNSGVAVIRVGGNSDVEMREKKHRVEDSLQAVRSAQSDGVVPGGGTVMYSLAMALKNKKIDLPEMSKEQADAIDILIDALKDPVRTMSFNSGVEFTPSFEKDFEAALKKDLGYNFLTYEYENLKDSGILDPAKVEICALKNAISVAGTLITTNYAIVDALD